MAKYQGVLKAYSSRPDRDGNIYWAMEYIDFETRATVNGMVSGGLSNIDEILRHWEVEDGWDDSVLFWHIPLDKRAFKVMTKGWQEAGCRSEDLAKYLRAGLRAQGREIEPCRSCKGTINFKSKCTACLD